MISESSEPMTVSSALVTLLHRILARKIGRVTSISTNQQGLTSIEGTLADALILHTYITSRKTQKKQFSMVALDIAKAFDTVPHEVILRALTRARIDTPMINYIANQLASTTTVINLGTKTTNLFHIK